MTTLHRFSVSAAVLALAFSAAAAPLWTPVRDAVYLQETGRQLPTEQPVFAVAVLDGVIYAGFGDGVRRVNGEALEPVPGGPAVFVQRMKALDGALWVMTDKGLHRFSKNAWTMVSGELFSDVCLHQDKVFAVSGSRLFQWDGAALALLTDGEGAVGPIRALASHAETLYCLGYDRLFLFDGKEFVTARRMNVEFGALPSKDLRDIVSAGSRLIVATHAGLGVVRGTAATAILGADGLPWEECLGLAPGFDRDYWVATTKGAIRAVDGEFHYFMGPRWLPDNQVNAAACGGRLAVFATNRGLGIIEYEPYTLQKKADYYERHLEEWGQKRMMFTHKLEWDGNRGHWTREVSDNDVGWSTHYWAAQAFKFAATGDPEARKNAAAGFNAMKWSEEITSIEGFPARSIWAVGETGHQAEGGSGGFAAEWHPTPDGLWEWKGDTSSDETDAQYYYAWVFYQTAATEKEKEKVRDHLRRMTDHIMDNGWVLMDVDGKPTVWGRWDPEYFNGKGKYAKGLNGLEILTYLRVTHAVTGDAKYLDAYNGLLERGYAEEVVHQKHVSPTPMIFHSDDRLAFYVYYGILQTETEPFMRGVYRRSLERSWEIERIERIPWFNFIYGALTGNDCELPEAVAHLREWPLDLVKHPYDFTHRADLQTPKGYMPYAKVERAFSPRETNACRWTDNRGEVRGGGGDVVDPAGWLDAYWMARYYGMILPPETDDPALLSVPRRGLQLGAPPYDGPPMPNVMD